MRPTVLLFDIDGTLLATAGAGRRAMVAAFREIYGRGDVFEGTSFAGMTDRAIVRHGLRGVAGRTSDGEPAAIAEQAIDRVLDVYVRCLHDELPKSDGYRVLPGVVALLEALRGATRHLAIGLGTGNVRLGALAKLARGGLDSSFSFGGFGCDAEDRVELLRAGARRGATALGVEMTVCRVVVIGDTPKDVAAARGLGAECVAVGTGDYEADELVRLGAKRGFATLEDERVHGTLVGDDA